MKQMKRALIIINITKNESLNLAKEIEAFLNTKSISCEFISFVGFGDRVSFCDFDFVITLGGDGTVLFAARNSVEQNIPIFPINLGQFGFIASIQPEDWKENLNSFLNDKSPITLRNMLSVKVLRDGKEIYTSYALNDAVICGKNAITTISLDIKYDDYNLCKLKSDGVIISTPTGSTAYSAAAGGPIVDPELDAIVMTPINSFSLSSRPIVLNTKGEILIAIEKSRTIEARISVDGQEPVDLFTGDKIIIKQFEKKVSLVGCTSENFYKALRSKLNWSGGPHA